MLVESESEHDVLAVQLLLLCSVRILLRVHLLFLLSPEIFELTPTLMKKARQSKRVDEVCHASQRSPVQTATTPLPHQHSQSRGLNCSAYKKSVLARGPAHSCTCALMA